MIWVSIADYIVGLTETLPEHYAGPAEHYANYKPFIEEFDLDLTDRRAFYLEVSRAFGWPFLCILQRYDPSNLGSFGILLVPETHVLFVGAGERLLAYDLQAPARLWEDRAEDGFHRWRRHNEVIVMSAQNDFFACTLQGTKLWSADVEPPWQYHVEGDVVYLDVMGSRSSFPLLSGPADS